MKRTRRIEAVRYTRRVTVCEGRPASDDTAADEPAADLILDALAVVPLEPVPANFDDSARGGPSVHHPPRRRLLARLGDLPRLRG